ncbi:MAG: chalcone isomerase family protein [Rhodoferax sp.]|nr:chalcone isomerase family protein [Rhodoferax sp.]MDP3654339.1 chalcone isomerase family protein [Rhodoferax sp.]
MAFGFGIRKLLPLGLLALACAMPAQAIEVSGVKVEDAVSVAGKELKLNGAGMRAILFVKFYAIGLYLSEKKTTPADAQAVAGPRRISLHIQREINSDEFGQLFIKGMNNNSTKEEKSKVIAQTIKFGEMFASMEPVKKGDVITLDWIPGTGTVAGLNGKKIGETMPDIAFYNAVLRIWLGDMPAQESVKRELLGGK